MATPFCCARGVVRTIEIDRAPKGDVKCETGFGSLERAGVGPAFRCSVAPVFVFLSAQPRGLRFAQHRPTKIEGSGTPANAGTTAASCDAARALSERARLTAFHRGSRLRELLPSQRLSARPGFLGRGLHGRYPPSPVPVQGCTSHPGHNAGRHDAQAARERTANPPAGTAFAAMARRASAPSPSRSEDCDVAVAETIVKDIVFKKVTLRQPAAMVHTFAVSVILPLATE
jgi:hypothetical protein